MTVKLRTGTPSSGKSYTSILDIWDYLYKGKLVIANFDVNFSSRDKKRGYDRRFFYVPNKKLTVEYLIVFALEHGLIEKMQEDQCLVVIDEAGGRFNVVQSKKSDIEEWGDFFSQHAKLGFSFVLIAQKDRMINRQILGMVELEIKHRKVNSFGKFKFLPFTWFVAIEYWYVAKARVKADFFFYTKRVARRYNRFKMFEGFKLSDALLAKVNNLHADLAKSYQAPITVISNNNDE